MELDFKKGSKEEPKGDVFCYTEFKSHKDIQVVKAPSLLVEYGTSDRKTFVRKSRELNISQKIIDSSREKSKLFEKLSGVSWYYFPCLEIKTELDLMKGNEDVVFAGRWSDLDIALYMLANVVKDYSELVSALEKTGNLKPRARPITFTAFPDQKDLRSHVYNNYIDQMLFAKLQKNDALFSDLREMFLEFSQGAPFLMQVIQICDRIDKKALSEQEGLDKTNLKIVDLLMEQAAAISAEEHEKAAKIRDQIRELGGD